MKGRYHKWHICARLSDLTRGRLRKPFSPFPLSIKWNVYLSKTDRKGMTNGKILHLSNWIRLTRQEGRLKPLVSPMTFLGSVRGVIRLLNTYWTIVFITRTRVKQISPLGKEIFPEPSVVYKKK